MNEIPAWIALSANVALDAPPGSLTLPTLRARAAWPALPGDLTIYVIPASSCQRGWTDCSDLGVCLATID